MIYQVCAISAKNVNCEMGIGETVGVWGLKWEGIKGVGVYRVESCVEYEVAGNYYHRLTICIWTVLIGGAPPSFMYCNNKSAKKS